MNTIAGFDSPEDAYLFRAFLDSRGIATTVLDEYVSQLFWHYRQAVGGTRVVLNDEADLPAARAAYEEYFTNLNAQPSLVTEVRAWPVVLLLSWFFGGPFLLFGRRALNRRSED